MRFRITSALLISSALLAGDSAFAQTPMSGLPGANGPVFATRVWGERLYIGGDLGRIGESAGGWVAYDPATGQPLPGLPRVAGVVYAACPDGQGGWYLGGEFLGANGQPRSNVLHALADGRLAAWAPRVDGSVNDLLLVGNRVFMAGRFTQVNGQARAHVAAVDASTGEVLDWSADTDLPAFALAVSGEDLFIGGEFTTVGGLHRVRVAKVAVQDGAVRPWDAGFRNGFGVGRLLLDRGRLLLSGNVVDSSGENYGFLALDPVTAQAIPGIGLRTSITGFVWDMVPHGGRIYLSARSFSLPTRVNEQALALDRATLQVLDWQPQPHDFATGSGLPSQGECYAIGAVGDRVYLAIAPDYPGEWSVVPVDTSTGFVRPGLPGLDGILSGVARMQAQGGRLWIGAGFRVPVGAARAGLAEIDLRTRSLTDWDPVLLGNPHSLVTIGSRLYLGYRSRLFGVPEPSGEAFDLPSHTKAVWSPDPTWRMDRLHEQSGRLFATGSSRNSGLSTDPWLRELDPTTGSATSWDPQVRGQVFKFASDAQALYIVGDFDSVGGEPRDGWAGFRLPDLALLPDRPSTLNEVSNIGLSEDRIVLAGRTSFWPNSDIVSLDRLSGLLQPWHPMQGLLGNGQAAQMMTHAYGSFLFSDYYVPGNVLRRCLYQQEPDVPTPTEFPFQVDDVPISMETHDGMLVLGGWFAYAGASPAAGLAVFTWPSTGVTSGGPPNARRIIASPDPARIAVTFTGLDVGVDRIEILDLAGRLVRTQGRDATMRATVSWDLLTSGGNRTSAGIHFARFLAGDHCVGTSRFVVLR